MRRAPFHGLRRLPLVAALCLTAVLLLAVTTAVLALLTYRSLAPARASGDEVRALLIAQSTARRIDRALAVGIPLAELNGVTALLQQRLAAYPEVERLAVVDGADKEHWSAERRHGALALHTDGPVARGMAPVRLDGRTIAEVRVVVRSPGLLAFVRGAALPLALGCGFFVVLAGIAALMAGATGASVRRWAVRAALRDIGNQRFDRITLVLDRRDFDLRVQRLARAVRDVQEMRVRTRRLIGSLRQTEPQPARRAWLDGQLASAEGGALYADQAPLMRRVVAVDPQCGWLALLAGTAVAALLGAVLMRRSQAFDGEWTGAAACATVLLAAAVSAWLLRRWRLPAWPVVLGGLASMALAGVLGLSITPLAGMLSVLLAGAGLGAVLEACDAVQRAARYRSVYLAVGRRRWLTNAGCVLGLTCFGPMLAALVRQTEAAASPLAALVALAPVLLAAASVARWHAVRSPWRMRPGRLPEVAPHAPWRWTAPFSGVVVAVVTATCLAAARTGLDDAPYRDAPALALLICLGFLAGRLSTRRFHMRRLPAACLALACAGWAPLLAMDGVAAQLLAVVLPTVAALSAGWALSGPCAAGEGAFRWLRDAALGAALVALLMGGVARLVEPGTRAGAAVASTGQVNP